MKNLGLKFAVVFLCWMWFSLLIYAFASTISISTDFNTATQYLKKIVVLDNSDNEKVVLNWSSNDKINVKWNVQVSWNVYADSFCKYGTTICINLNDIITKLTAIWRQISTKSIHLTEHFDYNSVYNWMTCSVDREWEIIYAYSDSNADDWYLYLCKKIPDPISPHYEWKQVNFN